MLNLPLSVSMHAATAAMTSGTRMCDESHSSRMMPRAVPGVCLSFGYGDAGVVAQFLVMRRSNPPNCGVALCWISQCGIAQRRVSFRVGSRLSAIPSMLAQRCDCYGAKRAVRAGLACVREDCTDEMLALARAQGFASKESQSCLTPTSITVLFLSTVIFLA